MLKQKRSAEIEKKKRAEAKKRALTKREKAEERGADQKRKAKEIGAEAERKRELEQRKVWR